MRLRGFDYKWCGGNVDNLNTMPTKSELENLLATTETYRVERTKSTRDKDKFGEVVCAFANDMPDCGKPGLFLHR